MFGIGAGEFIIILIVGLIVFGPSKLPEVGRAIGKGLREFRKAQAALSQTLNEVEEPPKSSTTVEKTVDKSTVDKSATADKAVEQNSPVDKTVDKPTVKPLTTDSFVGEKSATAEKTSADAQNSPVDKTVDKPTVDKDVDKPSQVTVDDVIKFAKENPLANEPKKSSSPVDKTVDKPPVDKTVDKPPVDKTVDKPPQSPPTMS